MKKTEHTPGPLFIRRNGDVFTLEKENSELRSIVASSSEAGLCPEHGGTAEANAARLVLCWNTHDGLVAALSRYGRHDRNCPLNNEANRPGDGRCACGFSAALARAEGESNGSGAPKT